MMLVCLGQISVTNPLPSMWGTCELPGDHPCAVATDTCIRIKKCQLGCQKHSICTQHVCICRLVIGFCIIQDKNQTASLGGMLIEYLFLDYLSTKKPAKRDWQPKQLELWFFQCYFVAVHFSAAIFYILYNFSICLCVLTRRTSKHVMWFKVVVNSFNRGACHYSCRPVESKMADFMTSLMS